VLPLDTRLPKPAADGLLDVLRPARVVSSDGVHHLEDASPPNRATPW